MRIKHTMTAGIAILALVFATTLPAASVSATGTGAVAVKRTGYVALGDSVAAGLGLLGTVPGSDPACGVTNQSYARLVAESLKTSYRTFACSGATAGDLRTEQHLTGTSRDIEPQLARAFAAGTPSLISITAGANDVQWNYFVNKCNTGNCGTLADRIAIAGLLGALRTKLSSSMRNISDRSNGHPPRVVLTGYYRMFSAACAQQQSNITAGEIAWLNKQTDALNRVLIDTAKDYRSFVRYAPVTFRGHELCTATPWVQGPQDKAPFHPTYSGQRIISKAVVVQAR
jgi:lysophospholipase L1-like esterase